MEQNQLQFSDVSKNREKFEYEMTEVALRLRGEFSKLTGEELQLKAGLRDVPRPEIETNIAQVQAAPFTPTHDMGSASAPGSLKELPALAPPEAPDVESLGAVHMPTIEKKEVAPTAAAPDLSFGSVKIPVIKKLESASVPEKAPTLPDPGDLAKRIVKAASAEVHCEDAPKIASAGPVSFSPEITKVTSAIVPPELPEAPDLASFDHAMQDILETARKQYKS